MTDPVFQAALQSILKHEGGYKPATADDPGGETNMGISKREYPDLDIKNLTVDRAGAIYWTDYWNKFHIGQIPAPLVAVKLADVGVDVGMREAIGCLQRALRCLGRKITEDGIIGPDTIVNVRAVNATVLLVALKSELAGHYRLVAAARPTEAGDLNGWLDRAYS